jgi:choline dehydrogenase-like flavoprotein
MKTIKYDCKAVVVGSGAGGAVAGATLAEAGVDTIIIEEGKYYKPGGHGTVFDGLVNMYVGGGSTLALGRPPISITLGRTVGGTTTINSSTCFRPPREKVESWCGPSWDELVPFFEEVERRINAKPADIELLGGNWRVLKRGCDALGIEIKPLVHNIRDCKMRGRCAFGCPEGAKQSVDVSFIPGAIEAGARLLASHAVDGVIVERGRAVGVVGKCGEDRFEVRAEAVILSMGTLRTPAFLLKKKMANSSRRVGKGLRIHPAARVVAEMNEIVDGQIGIPQGAYIDRWSSRGVMLEGIFLHPGVMMTSLPGVGQDLKELAAAYRRLSAFGVMVTDTSVGSVRPGHLGEPFTIQYQINRADAESLRFGIARVAEIYLAAGAKRIFTGFHKVPVVDSKAALERLESSHLTPHDLEVMAFHPLGTCRMGADPRKSVAGFSLETHDVESLFIMDGSVIPGSLGVNPQITIMALAMRAARMLAEKLGGRN